jgi:hypothetical protein
VDLDEVADDLYGLGPAEFVDARRRWVARARSAGDRELAAAAGKLARPTTSAWLVNRLVRAEGGQVAALLDLGAALRDAQSQLRGEELRRLSAQRQAVVAALARRARALGAEHGRTVGDAVAREVEGTLEAALADPAAADAVRSGRLTRALSYTGLGPGGGSPTGRTSAGLPAPPARPPASAGADRRAAAGETAAERERERRARRERDDALRAAQRRLTDADGTLRRARAQLDVTIADLAAADAHLDARRRRIAELTELLETARRVEADAGLAAAAAGRLVADAHRAVEEAENARADAARGLRQLRAG